MKENKKPENPSAFPDPMRGAEQGYSNQEPWLLEQGMTLRDYFAAKAMQGLMSMEDKGTHKRMEDCYDKIAEISYGVSDAMLKKREL